MNVLKYVIGPLTYVRLELMSSEDRAANMDFVNVIAFMRKMVPMTIVKFLKNKIIGSLKCNREPVLKQKVGKC